MRLAAVAAAGLALLATGCEQGEQQAQGRLGPSGFPVPRYVSLRFDEVNARAGPSDDHPVVWTYRTRGLPVQVIAETVDWRRVCDPEGAVAWVHRRTTDGRRTALYRGADPLPLLSRARTGEVRAYLAGRSVSELGDCENGWCEVGSGRSAGWVPQDRLWGVSEGVQCLMPDQQRARQAAAAR